MLVVYKHSSFAELRKGDISIRFRSQTKLTPPFHRNVQNIKWDISNDIFEGFQFQCNIKFQFISVV